MKDEVVPDLDARLLLQTTSPINAAPKDRSRSTPGGEKASQIDGLPLPHAFQRNTRSLTALTCNEGAMQMPTSGNVLFSEAGAGSRCAMLSQEQADRPAVPAVRHAGPRLWVIMSAFVQPASSRASARIGMLSNSPLS